MVDIESEVGNRIADLLEGIDVYSDEARIPARFPYVSISEADNYSLTTAKDTSGSNKYFVLMYEINVYSNKAVGRKAECKSIMDRIDSAMDGMGFTRMSRLPTPTQDTGVYRMTARYRAAADRSGTIYSNV